jgi:hypothetical protein
MPLWTERGSNSVVLFNLQVRVGGSLPKPTVLYCKFGLPDAGANGTVFSAGRGTTEGDTKVQDDTGLQVPPEAVAVEGRLKGREYVLQRPHGEMLADAAILVLAEVAIGLVHVDMTK